MRNPEIVFTCFHLFFCGSVVLREEVLRCQPWRSDSSRLAAFLLNRDICVLAAFSTGFCASLCVCAIWFVFLHISGDCWLLCISDRVCSCLVTKLSVCSSPRASPRAEPLTAAGRCSMRIMWPPVAPCQQFVFRVNRRVSRPVLETSYLRSHFDMTLWERD